PKVKRFTLRQMEELVKQLQRRYGYELYPERAYLIRIPLALMRRRMGPTDQFYEELDDTFRRCLRALRDNQSNNDPYSFRMLAKTLRLAPGMDSKYAQVALSCQFSIVNQERYDKEVSEGKIKD